MTTPAPELPLLRIAGLTKRFGGFTALDNVSVDFRPGERLGLIGPNGSGKTTLINCISGAFRTEPGTVVFRGEDITRLPPHLRTRRGIARSFQIPRPFKSMTVAENLMVALDFATVAGSFVPEAERRELAAVFRRSGVDADLADQVARQVSAHPDAALRVHVREELGVDHQDLPSPLTAAATSLVTFALGALVPLIPYLAGFGSLTASLALAAVVAFIGGGLVSRVTDRPFLIGAVRQLVLAGVAESMART